MSIRKIVILGPESSGKTTLCTELASRLNASLVPEFARQHLQEKGPAYSYEDLLPIAKGQLQLEQNALDQIEPSGHTQWLIMDTDLQVIRIWSEILFQKCDNRILSEIACRNYDYYLLTYPDLPWVPDPLRENEDIQQRMVIFHHFHDSLVNQSTPFGIVKGAGEPRTAAALKLLFDQFGDIGITS